MVPKGKSQTGFTDRIAYQALESLPVGINIVDRNMRILYANRFQRDYFPDRELPGRICYKAYMKDENREEECPWCATKVAFNTGKTTTRIAPSRMQDGTLFDHFQVVAVPLRNENNEIYAVMELVEDISAKVQRGEGQKKRMDGTQLGKMFAFNKFICASESSKTMRRKLERIIDTDATVLITGETGTGKNLIAETIHENSSRRAYSFVTINCTNIPETLLESHLFGHEKGAFTGAISTKKGMVEEAGKGTILLDEIGDLHLNLQSKLLRFLETNEFERVGSTISRKVDVRILAATNHDLEQLVNSGRFRSDLFYRLNVISLYVPPLRERREEIPILTSYFLEKICRESKSSPKSIHPRVMRIFLDYPWPGNIRQILHEIEQMVILGRYDDVLTADLLSSDLLAFSGDNPMIHGNLNEKATLHESIAIMEKRLVVDALRRTEGNRSEAARTLGLTRKGLLNKIKRYRIE